MYRFLAICVLAFPAFAADPAAPSISKVFDQQLTSLEKEFVPLVEAMPAEKFGFAPKDGEFNKVRTFALQANHVAYVNYAVAAAVLGEKNPSETGPNENGPKNLEGKEAIVKYVKASFAYTHKAMAMLTDRNLTDMVQSAFGDGKTTRIYMANVALWHSFDHYGQMVVYARMNGIVPPASRQ
jgi:uncharacterized damage-inducible protein DinB